MNRPDEPPGALLLGGNFVCLAAARNLAKHGVEVGVVGPATSLARFSRSVARFVQWPPNLPPDALPGFLAALARTRQIQGWVLFPTTDGQLRALAEHRSEMEAHFTLTTPAWETVRHCYDKRLTYALARTVGVPIPETRTAADCVDLSIADLEFPVVLKPAISERFFAASGQKAYRANDGPELERRYRAMVDVIPPEEVIVQEFLPNAAGNLASFAGYFRDGELVAGFSVRRKRQFPADFGRSSTFVEVVEIGELRELAGRLLGAIRYTGLAEVEFMWDGRHARYELLEVNARMWAWIGLAGAAGLDLAYLAFAGALGRKPELRTARPGVKWVRLVTDLRAAAHEIRAGRLRLGPYLRSLRGKNAFSVFSLSDPLPFIVEPLLLALGYVRRRLGRFFRRRHLADATGGFSAAGAAGPRPGKERGVAR